jgi:hypothetical protein
MMFFFKLLILISPTPASALSKHYPGLLAEPELEKMLVKVYNVYGCHVYLLYTLSLFAHS